MAQTPGELVGSMVWLVSRYAEKPGVIMKLGSILKDPENLESSLNLHDIIEIPEKDKRDASIAVRRHVQTELKRDNSLLVKAVPSIPAFSAGASAEGSWSHDAKTTIDALNVQATVFIPSSDYMNQALMNKNVLEYVRKGVFGKRLYIIVGTATASKLSIKEHQSKDNKIGGSVSLGVPGVAQGEGQASHGSSANLDSELEVGEKCDFAYRIRELFYSKFVGLRDNGDRTEKALFGYGSSKQDSDTEKEEVPNFEWFEEEDTLVPGLVAIPVEYEE